MLRRVKHTWPRRTLGHVWMAPPRGIIRRALAAFANPHIVAEFAAAARLSPTPALSIRSNDVVGTGQQHWRDPMSRAFCNIEIDNQLAFGRSPALLLGTYFMAAKVSTRLRLLKPITPMLG